MPARPAAGVRFVDPRIGEQLDEAEADANRAQLARDSFAAEHRHLIEAQEGREQMQRIKDALDGENPAALQAALRGIEKRGPGPLTTHDLPKVKS